MVLIFRKVVRLTHLSFSRCDGSCKHQNLGIWG